MEESPSPAAVALGNALYLIPPDEIDPDPDQPRKSFGQEDLEELAGSLKATGQLQPVLLRRATGSNRYVLIAGERRWRAAKLGALPALSCAILEGEAAERALEIQLTENAMRKDLDPLEQAHHYKRMLDRMGWSARRLARHLGVNASTITRSLALLEADPETQEAVIAGRITPREARGEARPKKAWVKALDGGGGVTVRVEAPRQLTYRQMAAALDQVRARLESDGRARPRGQAA